MDEVLFLEPELTGLVPVAVFEALADAVAVAEAVLAVAVVGVGETLDVVGPRC
jgi:hypothetical protein